MDQLPENVFALQDRKPEHKDANDQGKVLYFHPQLGWNSSSWMYPLHTGCTHWTYAPQDPPLDPEDPKASRDKAFEGWLLSFDHDFNESAKALIQLGWNGAWRKYKANY
jgi:hypothetical protein